MQKNVLQTSAQVQAQNTAQIQTYSQQLGFPLDYVALVSSGSRYQCHVTIVPGDEKTTTKFLRNQKNKTVTRKVTSKHWEKIIRCGNPNPDMILFWMTSDKNWYAYGDVIIFVDTTGTSFGCGRVVGEITSSSAIVNQNKPVISDLPTGVLDEDGNPIVPNGKKLCGFLLLDRVHFFKNPVQCPKTAVSKDAQNAQKDLEDSVAADLRKIIVQANSEVSENDLIPSSAVKAAN